MLPPASTLFVCPNMRYVLCAVRPHYVLTVHSVPSLCAVCCLPPLCATVCAIVCFHYVPPIQLTNLKAHIPAPGQAVHMQFSATYTGPRPLNQRTLVSPEHMNASSFLFANTFLQCYKTLSIPRLEGCERATTWWQLEIMM